MFELFYLCLELVDLNLKIKLMELCHFPANKNLQFISANRKSPNLSVWRSKPLINWPRHTFPGLTPTSWAIPTATDLPLSPSCLWDSPTSAPLPKRIFVLCRFFPTNKASVQIHTHPKSLPQILPAQKPSQTFSHWNSIALCFCTLIALLPLQKYALRRIIFVGLQAPWRQLGYPGSLHSTLPGAWYPVCWVELVHCLLSYFFLPHPRRLCCSLTKSCPTLCHPVDCNLPGFAVHGISQ